MRPKDVDELENNADSDQIAPEAAVWSRSAL